MAFGRRRRSTKFVATAEGIGTALGRVAARLDAWKRQRSELAGEIQDLLQQAQRMLDDVSDATSRGAADVAKAVRKGGRPKGYKMSAATKRKLRDAWKRRKAAIAAKVQAIKG
jgi:ABC-type transporter Mla subunit MlaD